MFAWSDKLSFILAVGLILAGVWLFEKNRLLRRYASARSAGSEGTDGTGARRLAGSGAILSRGSASRLSERKAEGSGGIVRPTGGQNAGFAGADEGRLFGARGASRLVGNAARISLDSRVRLIERGGAAIRRNRL